jgi:hypothetical protein
MNTRQIYCNLGRWEHTLQDFKIEDTTEEMQSGEVL